MEFKIINTETGEDKIYSHKTIAQFLFTHLEQYGDKIEDILKCMYQGNSTLQVYNLQRLS